MALEWIKITCDLPEKWQVMSVRRALKVRTTYEVVGMLVKLWAHFENHTTNGKLPGVLAEDVDRLIGRKGFAAALVAVQWLVCHEGGGVEIPAFSEYMGAASRAREAEADRKRRLRDRDEGGTSPGQVRDTTGTTGGTSPGHDRDRTGTQEREEEKEKEIEKGIPPSAVRPEPPQPAVSEPALLTFPVTGKQREWHLTESKAGEYRATYPGLDVLGALRAARQWCVDNPAKRKTYRGMPAFCSRWLERSVNRGQHLATGPPATVPFRAAAPTGKRTAADVIAEAKAKREAAEAAARTEATGT